MKTVKCRCGNRVLVQDKKGSLYTVRCKQCGLKVLNMFFGGANYNEKPIVQRKQQKSGEFPIKDED